MQSVTCLPIVLISFSAFHTVLSLSSLVADACLCPPPSLHHSNNFYFHSHSHQWLYKAVLLIPTMTPSTSFPLMKGISIFHFTVDGKFSLLYAGGGPLDLTNNCNSCTDANLANYLYTFCQGILLPFARQSYNQLFTKFPYAGTQNCI